MAYLRRIGVLYLKKSCLGNIFLHTTVMSPMMKNGSAGIIVIGDEILKGHVADTNSHFIARHLFDLGIKVRRISVIGDVEDEIAEEVQVFSNKFSYVITTGGIGPTHDDVTYSAVAKAFGEKVIPHPELVKICAEYFHTDDLNSPAMKLAHVPKSAKLTYGYDRFKGRTTLYPNVSVFNVSVFPGIPWLMERLFLAVYKELFNEGRIQMHGLNIYLNCTEVEIADNLNVIVSKYPNVTFGSYPKMFNRFYKVHITIQSSIKEECESAYHDLLAILPKEWIVNFDSEPTRDAYKKVCNLSLEKGKNHVQDALKMIEKFCEVYRPSEICVTFNGDPESVVLMHLLHACLRKNSASTILNAISFIKEFSQPDMDKFIKETQKRYDITLQKVSMPYDDDAKSFNGVLHKENFKAIFVGCAMGTRSYMIQFVANAEKHYSSLQWINPLKEWTMSDVWNFIHFLSLPYSTFYDYKK